MVEISVNAIRIDINNRMGTHINSMCATEDEVSLAYLLCEIDVLQETITGAANMMRGMMLDPAIPSGAKEAMGRKIKVLDNIGEPKQ